MFNLTGSLSYNFLNIFVFSLRPLTGSFQLLEFAYRYMTTILDDAKMVSGHAKKKVIDNDDIKLAVQVKQKFVKTIFCVCFLYILILLFTNSRLLKFIVYGRRDLGCALAHFQKISVFTNLNRKFPTHPTNFDLFNPISPS